MKIGRRWTLGHTSNKKLTANLDGLQPWQIKLCFLFLLDVSVSCDE